MKIRFQTKHPAGNLLFHGLRLMLRNWPCLLWAYAVCLVCGLPAGIHFSSRLADSLNRSLASRQLPGNLNAAHIRELAGYFHRPRLIPHPTPGLGTSTLWLALLGVALLLFFVAGTLPIYLTGEAPGFSILLNRGKEYFWRFLRIGVVAALVAGPILAGLIVARAFLLEQVSKVRPERTVFHTSIFVAAFIVLVALILRLWLDLAELCAVQRGMRRDRRIRLALIPALRLLARHFLSLFPTFFLAGLLGMGLLSACLFLWKDLVPAHRIWLASFALGLGLFFQLAARFWQRGMQAALLLALEPVMEPVREHIQEPSKTPAETDAKSRPKNPLPETAAATGPKNISEPNPQLSPKPAPEPAPEPTLQDLVRKLKNEPWASPESTAYLDPALFPQTSGTVARPPQDSLLAEHAKKVPLLDPAAEEAEQERKPTPPDSGPRSA